MHNKILAVQRMQDYIEEHLSCRITLADLARIACFSPFYSARIFKQSTGLTPQDYICRLRMSKSALRLRDEKCTILEAALEAGYTSADGYQRAFLRKFGCNPGEYSANPTFLPLFTPYGVKYRHIRKEAGKMEKTQVQVTIENKPQRQVIVKRGVNANDYWTYCQEVGCDVWGILVSMKSISGEPVCMWLPEKYRKPSTSEYVQGVEKSMDFRGALPEGFDIFTLPQATYLKFQGQPFQEEDFCQAIEALKAYIKDFDPGTMGFAWDTSNPDIQLEPIGTRGYIELKAVKAL